MRVTYFRKAVGVTKRALLVATSFPLTVAALAQELPLNAPPAAVLADGWAGPYIGAYLAATGSGNVREQADEAMLQPSIRTDRWSQADYSGHATGSMVDLFAGRNWRFGNFIVGGQVEATVASDIDLKVNGPLRFTQIERFGPFTRTTAGSTANGNDPQLKFRAGLIGRAGFLARPDLLLYGLAGIEFGYFTFPDEDDGFGSANRNFAIGYTAGAGVEARIDDRWSLRAEYRHLHFATSRSETWFQANSFQSAVHHTDVNMHVGKVGLVYRFGETGPSAAMAAMAPASRAVWADSWAGPYIGFYFSAGTGSVAETYSGNLDSRSASPGSLSTTNTVTSGSFSGSMNGSMNEAFLGYNWRSGRFVAGVQAEGTLFSSAGFKATGPQTTVTNSTFSGFVRPTDFRLDPGYDTQQLRSAIGLVGRAGFLATPNLLLYGLGGVEFGHFVHPKSSDAFGRENGKWVAGYTAGAGAELRINDHWSLRGEYRYLNFDIGRTRSTAGSSIQDLTGTISSDTNVTHRQAAVDFHVGKVGVAYKFGGAGPASAMAAIPTAVVENWTDGWAGPYFGAYFGAGAGTLRGDYASRQTSSTLITRTAPLAGNMSGTQVDLFAGYNIRSDKFVFGGQIEATQFSDVAAKAIGPFTLQIAGRDGYQGFDL
jgi:opacity protein-like surface antigen